MLSGQSTDYVLSVRRESAPAPWHVATDVITTSAAERLEKLAAQIEGDSKDDIDAEEEVCTKGTMQSFVDDQAKYLQHGIDEMM